MKRIERRRLKQNDLAETVSSLRDLFEARRRQLTIAAFVVVIVAAALLGIVIIRQQTRQQGDQLLADAMVALNAPVVPAGEQGAEGIPAAASLGATGAFGTEEAKLNAALPKLKAAAEAYPGAPAGITARYHMAGALAALGRYPDAIDAYTAVVERAGARTLYGRMARLGRADAQARAGQIDAAIAGWKALAAEDADDLPVDAILMELARAYVQQGNTEEARKTLSQIVDQHPNSSYSAEARAELANLRS